MPIERLKITSKNIVRDALVGHVYKGFYEYFHRQTEHLAERNCSICMMKHRSFVYKGEHFLFDRVYQGQRVRNMLHPDLKPIIEALIEERKQVEWKERPYVLNFFATILARDDIIGNYYELLPEHLHVVLDNLGLKRSEHTLSQEYIEAFKHVQQIPIALIQQRWVWDLIQ